MKINISEISNNKMSVNPPKEVVNAGYRVIHDKEVKCWVGIGWIVEHAADSKDYKNIPEVIEY